MHKWIGDVGFVATDTEMALLMQDAVMRKFLKEQGIDHFALFFLIANPDATTQRRATFARMMTSEQPNGMGEKEYLERLLQELFHHIETLFNSSRDDKEGG